MILNAVNMYYFELQLFSSDWTHFRIWPTYTATKSTDPFYPWYTYETYPTGIVAVHFLKPITVTFISSVFVVVCACFGFSSFSLNLVEEGNHLDYCFKNDTYPVRIELYYFLYLCFFIILSRNWYVMIVIIVACVCGRSKIIEGLS